MRRRTRRLIIVIFFLIILVPSLTVWLVSRIPDIEVPPCRNCASMYGSPVVPTVTLCELAAHREQYAGKVVRVSATFHHDSGTINLYDHDCVPSAAMYAGIAPSCEYCVGAKKALTMYTGYGTWYDSIATVTLVGRVGRIEGDNNFYRGYDGFNVLCVERVAPIGSGVGHRIYYTIGQIANRIYR